MNEKKDVSSPLGQALRLADRRASEARFQAARFDDDVVFLRQQRIAPAVPCPHCGAGRCVLWSVDRYVAHAAKTDGEHFGPEEEWDESHLCYACGRAFTPQTDEQKVADTNTLLREIRDQLGRSAAEFK